MMLPSLLPILQRFRQAAGSAGARRPGLLTVLVSVGCFGVWTAFGAVAFPLGVTLTAINMKLPVLAAAAPIATSVVVLARWRAAVHRVEGAPARLLPRGAGELLPDGGRHCSVAIWPAAGVLS
jgi:hypothetical protein